MGGSEGAGNSQDYAWARYNSVVANGAKIAKDAESEHPVDKQSMKKVRNILAFARATQKEDIRACLCGLIAQVVALVATKTDYKHDLWKKLLKTFDVTQQPSLR